MKGKYDKALILIELLKVEKGSDLDHNMCFIEIFVIVLCLNYFFKFIKTKCLNFLQPIKTKYLIFLKSIIKYSNDILIIVEFYSIFVQPFFYFHYDGCWDLVNISIFILKRNEIFWYFFINFFIFFVSCCSLFKESKTQNNLFVFVPIYSIFFDYGTSFIYCKIIEKNISSVEKIRLDKLILEFRKYLFIFLIVALLLWFYYYHEAKKWKIEYDKTEFNFIFLESILNSGVSFVTILSIFSMKLSGLYLLLALYIETYAAFIYPIVEMGKYLRGKELK